MKPLILILIIAILTYSFSMFLPWWISGVVAFIVCYFFKPGHFTAFTASLLAVFGVWLIKSYFADSNFDIPMSSILSKILGDMPTSSVFFLTGLIGGIPAGMAGLLGNWTRIFSNQK